MKADEIINSINEKLDGYNRNRKLTYDEVVGVKQDIMNIQSCYENDIGDLIQRSKLINSKHKKELDELSKKHEQEQDDLLRDKEIEIWKTRQIIIRNDLIWRGKILVRQLENDRFHTVAMARKQELDAIDFNDLIKKLKRQNMINVHQGVKLALAVICDKIVVNGFTKNICQESLDDNDEMHPKCKPLSSVIDELKTFKSIIQSLDENEQKKYNVTPNIISEEIKLFQMTEQKN